ncbi:MAG: hypothetical protein PHW04_05930 [Candidatus Wallbacteria bacterium]|nr:hypothetical protein [Candidatus Wallbacteria bacterium]
MLAYKGTLTNRIAKTGFQYPDEYRAERDVELNKKGIHTCSDPYVVFLYGHWEELWLVDIDVVETKHHVLLGNYVKFLKRLDFKDGLALTKDRPLFAYYWAVNFLEKLTEDELKLIMQNILENEECVISWAENIALFIPELSNQIITPRYAYLWKIEGFPMNSRLETLAQEYARLSKGMWNAKSHLSVSQTPASLSPGQIQMPFTGKK